jgi:hypothetical protein
MSEQMQTPTSSPVPPKTATGSGKGLAIASLVLGILSLCASVTWWCGGPISVVGIILGALGIKSSGRTMAIIGIVLSAIGFLSLLVFHFIFPSIFRGLIPQLLKLPGQ